MFLVDITVLSETAIAGQIKGSSWYFETEIHIKGHIIVKLFSI
jgi:hypothetical protein